MALLDLLQKKGSERRFRRIWNRLKKQELKGLVYLGKFWPTKIMFRTRDTIRIDLSASHKVPTKVFSLGGFWPRVREVSKEGKSVMDFGFFREESPRIRAQDRQL